LNKKAKKINTRNKVGKFMKKIIFLGILVFIVSIGVGYFYSSTFMNENNSGVSQFEKNELEDYAMVNSTGVQTLEASSEEEKISPNATFAVKEYFDECGHFNFSYESLPKDLVNLSRQEVEDYYDDYEVEEFSSNDVVIAKEINGLCSEHFYVKLGDENVEVLRLNTDGSFSKYQDTEISRAYLPEEDISKLEEGIYVYGSGKINSVLEDYE
jgi:hypothetical protein